MKQQRVQRRSSLNLLQFATGADNASSGTSASDSGERERDSRRAESTQKPQQPSYKLDATIGISTDTTQEIQEYHQIEGEPPEARALEETETTYACADCKFPLKRGESSCPSCKSELDWGAIA